MFLIYHLLHSSFKNSSALLEQLKIQKLSLIPSINRVQPQLKISELAQDRGGLGIMSKHI
jgi:hypothetical protein